MKQVTADTVRYSVDLSNEQMDALKQVSQLMLEKGETSPGNAIGEIANDWLDRNDPVRKAQRAVDRALERADKRAADTLTATNEIRNAVPVESKRDEDTHPNPGACTNPSAYPSFGAPPNLKAPSNVPHPDHVSNDDAFCPAGISLEYPPVLTRYKRIPLTAAQKHAVWLRDGGRCTHIAIDGRRCEGRRYLDAHHIVEVSKGGTNAPENLTLLCADHHALVHQQCFPIDGPVSWVRERTKAYVA